MITVCVGSDCRRLSDADASWIASELAGRRRDGHTVCVKVTVNERDCNVLLTTPGCGEGSPGGREPNSNERRLFELWDKHGLNAPGFSVGGLVSFLKQL